MNENLRRWLPWIGVAVVAVVVIVLIAVNAGDDDDAAATTTTAGDTTTTTTAETTTTVGETTTTEAPMALEPIPMRIGSILPQTGRLATIISALEDPVRMAVEEINAASPGLLEVTYADTGTDATTASTNVDEFLTGEYNAIVGPAATPVTLGIHDKVATSQIPMCSGSNTGALLSGPEYDPWYIRTSPSDDIQGPTLGDLILGDGHASVAVVYASDEYAMGLGEAVAGTLESGGATVPVQEGYDPAATSFGDLAANIAATDAEAVAMFGYVEQWQILQDLRAAGFEGQVYVADGFVDVVSAEVVGDNGALLAGIRGTYPAVAPALGEPTFSERFAAFSPDAPQVFSAYFYDCVVVQVLAAQEAQSSDPTVFVDHLISVTRDGEKCNLFADCLALLQDGVDIDYDGASGPLDFGPNGEPTVGVYDLLEYDETGTYASFDQVQREL